LDLVILENLLFLKQIKYLFFQGPGILEMNKFRVILQDNCLRSMQTILLSERVHLPEELKNHKEAVISSPELIECVEDIIILWRHPIIKDAFERRNELYIGIPSTSDYFFLHAKRFADPYFQPSVSDIMRAKSKTTGINQIEVEHKGFSIVLIDVGGQRSERRKWFHLFDQVNAAIFLAALDEYDMVLEEDPKTNRLTESLNLFKEMTETTIFRPPSWILFLNKHDLFEQKIQTKPLSKSFTQISTEDAADVKKSYRFIRSLFKEHYQGQQTLYVHHTCALDTTQIDSIFKSIRDYLLCEDLSIHGVV